ncbi:MAG: cytochrome c [Acidobacteriota bacterium]
MKRVLISSFVLSLIMLAAPAAFAQAADDAAAETTEATASTADPLVERGRYLVEGVGMCGHCHSGRTADGELEKSDWLGGAPVPVTMPPTWAKPWAYRAPRIAGLPQHTDEEFVKLMTTGVNRDGRILMLPMPQFRMTDEDATAIAAYLRTLR